MLSNILAVTIRNFRKRKFYALLNILGFATSMSFAFLLWLFIQDQLVYDKHYKNADRIYRVGADFNMNGKRDIYSNAPRPIGPYLKIDFPEVEQFARLRGVGSLWTHTGTFLVGNRRVKSEKLFYADSTVFEIFDQDFVSGDARHALDQPNSIVITQSLGKRLFGYKDPQDKTVRLGGSRPVDLKVTGVIRDPEGHSHISSDGYISWSTTPSSGDLTTWYGAHVYTYILLNKGSSIEALHAKFPSFFEAHMKERFEQLNGTADLVFQPLTSVYLDEEYVWEPYPHGSRTDVKALIIIVVALIVFACINYINLATARATERGAEVSIRKILGSPRKYLIIQFLGESIILSLISGVIAFLLALFVLSKFNEISGLSVSISDMVDPARLGVLLTFSLFIGFLSGVYPSIYLSSLKSLERRGYSKVDSGGVWLRKLLVIFQYFIASVMIAGIFVVTDQIYFIKNKDIGYEAENILTVTIPADTFVTRRTVIFEEELRADPQIIATAKSFYSLDGEATQFTPTLENPDGSTFQMGADLLFADYNFVNTVGIEVLVGRNFGKETFVEDQLSMLINETALRKFGWEQDPLSGKARYGRDAEGNIREINVIGVLKDFNLGPSYNEINPLIIFMNNHGGGNLYIRISKEEVRTTIARLEAKWVNFFPGRPFEFKFVDESLDALYKTEDKFLNLLGMLTAVTILVASLGIAGLISFTAQMKRKEIAIRKIHGASLKTIMLLLSRRFASLLILANVLAVPVIYHLVGLWLDSFAIHIKLSIWPFFISFVSCFFFTAVALVYHVVKAAVANPVNALRYE